MVAVLALGYRLALSQVYFGWEESDYGNLAMIKGVVDHGFGQYDMNHLPMYYFLSAVVMSVVGDAQTAGLVVSMGSGVLTVVLGVMLAQQLALKGGHVEGLFGVPTEPALYSSSTLESRCMQPCWHACCRW